MQNNEEDKKQLKTGDEKGIYKPLTREEYEAMTKKNMKEIMALQKQLAEERAAEDEKLSKMTDDECVEYLLKESQKMHAEAKGKFKNTVKIVSKEEKKGAKK